jgi:periplasmic protein TonB
VVWPVHDPTPVLAVTGFSADPGWPEAVAGPGDCPASGKGGARARLWLGLACSLALHVVLAGLVLAMTGDRGCLRAKPLPVVLDVVLGAPSGDGSPGDGAAGREGQAGGPAGIGEEAASPQVVPGPPQTPSVAASPEAVSTTPSRTPAPRPHPTRIRPRTVPRPSPLGNGPGQAQAAKPLEPAVSAAPSATPEIAGSPGGAGGSGAWATAGLGVGEGPGKGGQGGGTGAGGQGGGRFEGEFGTGNGPCFARHVRPDYPVQARRFGKEGEVVLRLDIDAAGRLTQAVVVHRGGSGFDEAALAAVRASTYRPARQDGRSVPGRALLRIRFQLAGM